MNHPVEVSVVVEVLQFAMLSSKSDACTLHSTPHLNIFVGFRQLRTALKLWCEATTTLGEQESKCTHFLYPPAMSAGASVETLKVFLSIVPSTLYEPGPTSFKVP